MLIWLIGLSGSGKTTIGKRLYDKLKLSDEKWIFLDGDIFRHILGEDLGHTIEDRRKNAYRISRFCEFLTSQNINVIACVLSIFHDNQRYNRKNIKDYKEVYIDVSMDNLIKRDNKKIYEKALSGELENVVGVDIEFKPPYSPDMVIDNNEDTNNFEQYIEAILDKFKIKLDVSYDYTKKYLLKSPEKYQYSLFEGKNFFDKYTKDRMDSIKMLKNRKKIFLENNYEFKNIAFSEKYIQNENILLTEYLAYLLESEQIDWKMHFERIELLIKRFEVSKKLFETYDEKEIRKSSFEYSKLLNYSLFSLVLQKLYYNMHKYEQKIIYLNVILKLNDILSSVKKDIILPLDIGYSIKALEGEMHIIKDYIC